MPRREFSTTGPSPKFEDPLRSSESQKQIRRTSTARTRIEKRTAESMGPGFKFQRTLRFGASARSGRTKENWRLEGGEGSAHRGGLARSQAFGM